MLQIVLRSVVLLNYIVTIALQLKWAWDYLLYQSFFYSNGVGLPEYVDDTDVRVYEKDSDQSEDQHSQECAVCLCTIDEGDEVREIRCKHLFHRACLDRWFGYGHMTCPLCRNNLRLPPVAAELHQEVVLINFSATGYSDRFGWWLR